MVIWQPFLLLMALGFDPFGVSVWPELGSGYALRAIHRRVSKSFILHKLGPETAQALALHA